MLGFTDAERTSGFTDDLVKREVLVFDVFRHEMRKNFVLSICVAVIILIG